jgi:hypothetical protein
MYTYTMNERFKGRKGILNVTSPLLHGGFVLWKGDDTSDHHPPFEDCKSFDTNLERATHKRRVHRRPQGQPKRLRPSWGASPSIAVDTYDRHLSDMGREGHDKDLAMGRVCSQADEARHVDHKSTNKNIVSKASHKPK